jgi:hypothetical protein
MEYLHDRDVAVNREPLRKVVYQKNVVSCGHFLRKSVIKKGRNTVTPQKRWKTVISNICCSCSVPRGRKGVWGRLIHAAAKYSELTKLLEPPAELECVNAGTADKVTVVFKRGQCDFYWGCLLHHRLGVRETRRQLLPIMLLMTSMSCFVKVLSAISVAKYTHTTTPNMMKMLIGLR